MTTELGETIMHTNGIQLKRAGPDTGQNALQQAKAFKEAVQVTGIILAKLDTSARGGMAFAIQEELGLPILFAGLGEKSEDLTPFDPEGFIDGILAAW